MFFGFEFCGLTFCGIAFEGGMYIMYIRLLLEDTKNTKTARIMARKWQTARIMTRKMGAVRKGRGCAYNNYIWGFNTNVNNKLTGW